MHGPRIGEVLHDAAGVDMEMWANDVILSIRCIVVSKDTRRWYDRFALEFLSGMRLEDHYDRNTDLAASSMGTDGMG